MKANILEEWYRESSLLASPLQIRPLANRQTIDYIYNRLSKSFGTSYFEYVPGQDLQKEKIPWLFSFLANRGHLGCVLGLLEIAKLIEYLETLDDSIQQMFRNYLSSPESMRSFFFELFIFYLWDRNQIPNRKKVWDGQQELEGTLTINDKIFLYECRKTFIPNGDELDLVIRALSQLSLAIRGLRISVPKGMIWIIQFPRPLKFKPGFYVFRISKVVGSFIKKLNRLPSLETIIYEEEIDGCIFKALDLTEADHIELTSKREYDLLITFRPTGPIGEFNVNISGNFSVDHDKIYKKLEEAIREKRDQHRNSQYENQILFLDNEELPEFNMPIFPNNNILEIERIVEICKKLKLKSVLIIIRREYHKWHLKYIPLIFYPEHLKREALIIGKAIDKINSSIGYNSELMLVCFDHRNVVL